MPARHPHHCSNPADDLDRSLLIALSCSASCWGVRQFSSLRPRSAWSCRFVTWCRGDTDPPNATCHASNTARQPRWTEPSTATTCRSIPSTCWPSEKCAAGSPSPRGHRSTLSWAVRISRHQPHQYPAWRPLRSSPFGGRMIQIALRRTHSPICRDLSAARQILDRAAPRERRPGCVCLRVGHRGELSTTAVAPPIVPRAADVASLSSSSSPRWPTSSSCSTPSRPTTKNC